MSAADPIYAEPGVTYNQAAQRFYGDNPQGVQFVVETALANNPLEENESGYVWTQHTDIRAIGVMRGRQSGLGRMETGVARIVFRNQDGKWDPDNPNSPYSPNIKLRKRVRIRAIGYNRTWPIFDGFIEELDPDVKGWNDRVMHITLADGFKIFATIDLPSLWEYEVRQDNPAAWYRLGEEELIGSKPVAFDASGNNRHGSYVPPGGTTRSTSPTPEIVFPGTGYDGVAVGDDDQAIKSLDYRLTNNVREGPHVVFPKALPSGVSNWAVEFWTYGVGWVELPGPRDDPNLVVDQPAILHGGTINDDPEFTSYEFKITRQTILLTNPAPPPWYVYDRYRHSLVVRVQASSGSVYSVERTYEVATQPYLETDYDKGIHPSHPLAHQWNHWVGERDGVNINFYVNGKKHTTFINSTDSNISTPTSVLFPQYGFDQLIVDEVAIYNQILGQTRVTEHISAARTPAFGERADQRLSRVLTMARWPQSRRVLSPSLSVFKESVLRTRMLDYVHRISEGEQAPILIDREGNVRFRNRTDINNPPYNQPQGLFGTSGYWETELTFDEAVGSTVLNVASVAGVKVGSRLLITDTFKNEIAVVTAVSSAALTVTIAAPGVQFAHSVGVKVSGEMPFLTPEPSRKFSDEDIINSVRLGRVGGTIFSAIDQASIDQYGENSYEKTNMLNSDDQSVVEYAVRLLAAYAQPRIKIDTVQVHSGFGEAVDRQMLAREIEDMIRLVLRPYGSTGPVFDYSVRIQKITVGIEEGSDNWTVRWDVSPYEVSV